MAGAPSKRSGAWAARERPFHATPADRFPCRRHFVSVCLREVFALAVAVRGSVRGDLCLREKGCG